jgi:signal transduction histidine kinase/ligand-binding sensor domain-containing protein
MSFPAAARPRSYGLVLAVGPGRSHWRLCAAALTWVLVSSVAAAAQAQPRLRTWTTAHGLPQNTVHSIAQTPEGYLWLGTRDGLARFDGVRFHVFNRGNTPELPTNRIGRLFVDAGGRLWIYPEASRMLVVRENGRFTALVQGRDFEADNLYEPQRAGHPMRLRFGDVDYVFDNGRFTRQAAGARLPPRVFSDDGRTVWIESGDDYLAAADGRLTRHARTAVPPFDPRRTMAWPSVEANGDLWFYLPFGDEFTLCRLRNGQLAVSNLSQRDLPSLMVDRSGHLWIGGAPDGFRRIEAAAIRGGDISGLTPEWVASAGSDLNAVTMFSDRDANLWLGTDSGLHLVHGDPVVTVYSRASGLASDNVYPIVQDASGAIWFGAWNLHLIRYADGVFDAEPMTYVTALALDRDNRLWSAASHSLAYREDGRWRPFRVPGLELGSEMSVIAQTRDGAMWFGNSSGIARYENGTSRLFTTDDGLPGTVVTSFLETAAGSIWVGTTDGLARFERGRWTAFTEERDGLAGNFIRSLYEDRDATLWIGTYDSGLTRYAGGRFASITSRHGLFSDGAFCLLEDDAGWLWMNSNQGIYRARRQELNDVADGVRSSVTSVAYGPEDGLSEVEGNGGKQPACLRSADGRLWFATAGGLAVIDPRSTREVVAPPRVVIEDRLVDGREAAAGAVRLEPGQRTLEIRYTALNFRGAERIRFRYRLEGLDGDWTEAGTRRFAFFSHLPYGDYTFRVSAADRDGLWNDDGPTIPIRVVAPFFRTPWFYALAAAGLVGLVVLAYSYRVAQLQKLNRIRAQYTERLMHAEEAERRRLALELHDSIGQSLAVIRNRALISLSTPGDHERLIDQMQQISEAAAMATQETRQIALNLHPAQLDHLGLSTALASLVTSVEGGSIISFDTRIDDVSGRVTAAEAISLYRIAQECLSNIIRHSDAQHVVVSLELRGESLQLAISDDGRGFATGDPATGLGLTGIRERARILNADLRIESAPGKGTRVALTLPRRPDASG